MDKLRSIITTSEDGGWGYMLIDHDGYYVDGIKPTHKTETDASEAAAHRSRELLADWARRRR